MAPSDVVDQVVTAAANYLSYMMPIIGIMAGITFTVSLLYYFAIKFAQRIVSK